MVDNNYSMINMDDDGWIDLMIGYNRIIIP